MSDRDYYEILGLTPGADSAMVDAAYWHLVRKYQALSETNVNAPYMIDQLNEAYGVLGNPRLREQYDAFRDDVLISRGMIRPVKAKQPKSKPEKREAKTAAQSGTGRRLPGLPAIRVQHWRTYAVSAVIVALAFAGAWQGVNIVFVALALVAGLAFSLTPALGRRMREVTFELPSVAIPDVRAPKLSLPSLSDVQLPALSELAPRHEEGIDADTLRRSTAETIARWRHSVGLKVRAPEEEPVGVPLAEAVAAAEIEQAAGHDPLVAVMDILRGARAKAAEEAADAETEQAANGAWTSDPA